MSDLKITGYGDELTINGIKLGDLSPSDHEQIELDKGGQNYSPLENVVVSHVKDSSTLICRKPSNNDVEKYVENEASNFFLIDHEMTQLSKRKKFSHKGTYGHTLLIAGEMGKRELAGYQQKHL